MNDLAIKIENLTKNYRIGEIGTGTLSHDLNRQIAKWRGKDDPFSKVTSVNDRSQKAEKGHKRHFEKKQGIVQPQGRASQ